jgi:hypothetical protein
LKDGREFTITQEDVVVPVKCPVLGIPIAVEHGKCGMKESSPSLDRINSKLGYVKGNVGVISRKANTIKSYGTAEEHRKIADWMDEFSAKGEHT